MLGHSLLSRVDGLTRSYWRAVGRPVDLEGRENWLRAPMHGRGRVGDRWLEAAATAWGGVLCEPPNAGLLSAMSVLDGPDFRASELRAEVCDFYEHTTAWRIRVRTRWNPVFRPAGTFISRLFGHRIQQLALPTRPSDAAHGMDSRVTVIQDDKGAQLAAGWLRTMRSTGEYVYSGCYSTAVLPGDLQPLVHVAFPLESGNVQVFLRPRTLPGGALELSSPPGRFGDAGADVIVADRGTHAARVPLHETFRVYVDQAGTLRADHRLALWSAPVVQLHYELVRSEARGAD